MDIFGCDEERRRFLELLAEVVETLHVECISFCLMGNHYHLVVRTLHANISATVKRLNGLYAQWWNRRRHRVGHVFQARFDAQVVQDDTYLLVACRYDALNPVRAELVRLPEDWPWSSYRPTVGLATLPSFLCPDALWHQLSDGDPAVGALRFRAFVRAGITGDVRLPANAVLGDEGFARRFDGFLRHASHEVPMRERDCRPPLWETLAASKRAGRLLEEEVVAAYEAGYAMADVARHVGVHYVSVSRMLARSRRCRNVRPDPKEGA